MRKSTRRGMICAMGRVIGWIFGLLVLFAIITNPTQAAGTTTYLVSGVASAGQQVIYFFQSLVVTTPSDTTPSSTTYYPVGGVETGDGSYPLVSCAGSSL